jgi:hypothetical protein
MVVKLRMFFISSCFPLCATIFCSFLAKGYPLQSGLGELLGNLCRAQIKKLLYQTNDKGGKIGKNQKVLKTV